MVKGNLTITLYEGVLTRNTELWGKMDPYAVFKHNNAVHKSHVDDDAGFTPKWKDTHFDFVIKEANEQIHVDILD
jgi:C2 domain